MRAPETSALDTSTRLLLACLKAAVNKSTAELESLLQVAAVDWNALAELARRHGVRPLVFLALSQIDEGGVPQATMAQLRTAVADIGRRNLLLSAELIRLLAALEEIGVQAFAFKGPVLAASAYGNVALREFADLDVMVHRRDMGRARQHLSSLGYAPKRSMNRAQEDIIMRLNGEYDLFSADRRIPLDLHWAFTSRYFHLNQEPPDHWQRVVRIPLGGAQLSGLPPVDLLIVLCLHGAKACWVQLKWICDVAQTSRLIAASDWDQVIQRARAWGGQRSLLLGLALARAFLGTVLPDVVVSAADQDRAVHRLVPRITEWIKTEPGQHRSRAQEARLQVTLSRTPLTSLRVWARLLMMPTWEDAAHLPLGGRWRVAYYLVRPFRLLIKHFGHDASLPTPAEASGPGR